MLDVDKTDLRHCIHIDSCSYHVSRAKHVAMILEIKGSIEHYSEAPLAHAETDRLEV
jgi:hypothetical protein